MNNYEKTREVLEGLNSLFESGAICTSYMNTAEETWQIEELYRKAQAALALPPRQCDVGTPEEQKRRFNKFCKRKGDGFSASAYCAYECPCGNRGDCKLAWAQTPYEEGGAE